MENNQVTITGTVVSDPVFNHESFGTKLYSFNVSSKRLSGQADVIPVLADEKLLYKVFDYKDAYVKITGQFRSCSYHLGDRDRLILSVFAKEIDVLTEPEEECDTNEIYLVGYVCKPPVYRKTPMGREITDLLVASNRSFGKSDYIPCICWEKNARTAAGFNVGDKYIFKGRIQSREYMKKLDPETVVKKTAYEISINTFVPAVPDNVVLQA